MHIEDERALNAVAQPARIGVVLRAMKKFALLLLITSTTPVNAAYHVARHINIGGTGGWDYLTVDSASRRLFVSHSDRVEVVDIDHQKVVGTIPKTEIADIDAKKLTVEHRWPLAPCEEPSGLAIDRKHHRLFSVCSNQKMVVVDNQ